MANDPKDKKDRDKRQVDVHWQKLEHEQPDWQQPDWQQPDWKQPDWEPPSHDAPKWTAPDWGQPSWAKWDSEPEPPHQVVGQPATPEPVSGGFSPIDIEVTYHLFQSIAEEMGATLMRAAFSPNIKERRDHSCAVFDGRGALIAQAAHIPVHLGSMPLSVAAAIAAAPPKPGQSIILNDPYHGGTHLPDLTLVTPVFAAGAQTPSFWVANRAHHADVGGDVPGSLPISTHIDNEGIRLEPVVFDPSVVEAFCAASRTPDERRGDLAAQTAANRVGQSRLEELSAGRTGEALRAMGDQLMAYSERIVGSVLEAIPDGEYSAVERMEGDGFDAREVELACTVTVRGRRCSMDFTASADQVAGPINAVAAITRSAVFYVVRTLAPEDLPTNAGCLRPVQILTRPGSVLDARFPAPVAVGNVETSQRVVDLIFKALAPALPDRIPAASVGSMNNVCMGGGTPRPFVYYETIGGGAGAGPGWHGEDGIHAHMTNTLNTPVEAFEHAYPLRITAYRLRRGSGGAGTWRGGEGIVREYEFTQPTTVTVFAERQVRGPYGLSGGKAGLPGAIWLIEPDGSERRLAGKVVFDAEPGQRLRIETAGGGGFGA